MRAVAYGLVAAVVLGAHGAQARTSDLPASTRAWKQTAPRPGSSTAPAAPATYPTLDAYCASVRSGLDERACTYPSAEDVQPCPCGAVDPAASAGSQYVSGAVVLARPAAPLLEARVVHLYTDAHSLGACQLAVRTSAGWHVVPMDVECGEPVMAHDYSQNVRFTRFVQQGSTLRLEYIETTTNAAGPDGSGVASSSGSTRSAVTCTLAPSGEPTCSAPRPLGRAPRARRPVTRR